MVEKDWICIVRVRTNVFERSAGDLVYSKSLRVLKRYSRGFNPIQHDIEYVGAEQTLPSITNFHQVEDGLYSLEVSRTHRDWETGYIDEVYYALEPWEKPKR
jgi:hypothetical protein